MWCRAARGTLPAAVSLPLVVVAMLLLCGVAVSGVLGQRREIYVDRSNGGTLDGTTLATAWPELSFGFLDATGNGAFPAGPAVVYVAPGMYDRVNQDVNVAVNEALTNVTIVGLGTADPWSSSDPTEVAIVRCAGGCLRTFTLTGRAAGVLDVRFENIRFEDDAAGGFGEVAVQVVSEADVGHRVSVHQCHFEDSGEVGALSVSGPASLEVTESNFVSTSLATGAVIDAQANTKSLTLRGNEFHDVSGVGGVGVRVVDGVDGAVVIEDNRFERNGGPLGTEQRGSAVQIDSATVAVGSLTITGNSFSGNVDRIGAAANATAHAGDAVSCTGLAPTGGFSQSGNLFCGEPALANVACHGWNESAAAAPFVWEDACGVCAGDNLARDCQGVCHFFGAENNVSSACAAAGRDFFLHGAGNLTMAGLPINGTAPRGSAANPFATLAEALAQARLFDVITVAPGVYSGAGNANQDVPTAAGGVTGTGFEIACAEAGRPDLCVFAGEPVLRLTGSAASRDFVLRDLTLRTTGGAGAGSALVMLDGASPTLRGVVFDTAATAGTAAGSTADPLALATNLSWPVLTSGCSFVGAPDAGGLGLMDAHADVDQGVFRSTGSTVQTGRGIAVQAAEHAPQVTVRDSIFALPTPSSGTYAGGCLRFAPSAAAVDGSRLLLERNRFNGADPASNAQPTAVECTPRIELTEDGSNAFCPSAGRTTAEVVACGGSGATATWPSALVGPNVPAGNASSYAVEDSCGVCGGGDADLDCAGDCFGVAALDSRSDCCDLLTETDCAGFCNQTFSRDGTAEATCCETTRIDCNDVCNGTAVVDRDAVCCANASLLDCNSTCNGASFNDTQGTCCGASDPTDCFGVCNGNAFNDTTSACCAGGTPTDCFGVCGGSAFNDTQGTCCPLGTPTDCLGVCNGTASNATASGACCANGVAAIDCFGECDGTATPDVNGTCCAAADPRDCAGVCNGTAVLLPTGGGCAQPLPPPPPPAPAPANSTAGGADGDESYLIPFLPLDTLYVLIIIGALAVICLLLICITLYCLVAGGGDDDDSSSSSYSDTYPDGDIPLSDQNGGGGGGSAGGSGGGGRGRSRSRSRSPDSRDRSRSPGDRDDGYSSTRSSRSSFSSSSFSSSSRSRSRRGSSRRSSSALSSRSATTSPSRRNNDSLRRAAVTAAATLRSADGAPGGGGSSDDDDSDEHEVVELDEVGASAPAPTPASLAGGMSPAPTRERSGTEARLAALEAEREQMSRDRDRDAAEREELQAQVKKLTQETERLRALAQQQQQQQQQQQDVPGADLGYRALRPMTDEQNTPVFASKLPIPDVFKTNALTKQQTRVAAWSVDEVCDWLRRIDFSSGARAASSSSSSSSSHLLPFPGGEDGPAAAQATHAEDGPNERYAAEFRSQAVTGSVLVELTNEDLKDELHVDTLGHRKLILKYITAITSGVTDIDFSDVVLGPEVGRGAQGIVYRARYAGMDVAVKVLKTQTFDTSVLKELLLESTIMKALQGESHPNISRMFGLCLTPPNIAIVTEFCELGALCDRFESLVTSWADVVWLGLGVARGMTCMHRHNYVHRDLAARNILLGRDEGDRVIPIVTDFGMSRFLIGDVQTTRTNHFALKWTAPETLSDLAYGKPSDVWAFGVLMVELIRRGDPYPGIPDEMVAIRVRDQGYHPELVTDTPAELRKLLLPCWERLATDRPTFANLAASLESINASLEVGASAA